MRSELSRAPPTEPDDFACAPLHGPHISPAPPPCPGRYVVNGLRMWLNWLYWQDVLQPGIELGIAWLLEAGHIGVADIWLFSRVIEDTVDTILTRSRAEAQLATLVGNAKQLEALHEAISAAQAAEKVLCGLGRIAGDDDAAVTIRCDFSRGHARVRVGDATSGASARLPPAVYALTGANGSGKSTLLALLSSCARGGLPPQGVTFHATCQIDISLTDDAAQIVEVPQRLYCPLHCSPIRWLAQSMLEGAAAGSSESADATTMAARAAGLLSQLKFRSNGDDSGEMALATELLAEHDDYVRTITRAQPHTLSLPPAHPTDLVASTCTTRTCTRACVRSAGASRGGSAPSWSCYGACCSAPRVPRSSSSTSSSRRSTPRPRPPSRAR